MERVIILCFTIFVLIFDSSAGISLSPSTERLNWKNAKSRCDTATRSMLCDNSTDCVVTLDDNVVITETTDFTAWIDGYVKRTPFMTPLGCHNVSSNTLTSSYITAVSVPNNDVTSCALSCGPFLYYGLKNNTCICINTTIDNFVRTPKENCNSKCAGNKDEDCGGTSNIYSVLTVYTVERGVLKQGCQSVSQSGLIENATVKYTFNSNSYLFCHNACGFEFALEGNTCYCLNNIILQLRDIDSGLCNNLCSGNQFERCGGSPLIPEYNFVTLYQTLPDTLDIYSDHGEDCAAVVRSGDDLYTTVKLNCNQRQRFICDSTTAGREYSTFSLSWSDARRYCEYHRDGLAVQFYYKNLVRDTFYWIGYFRGSQAVWGEDLPEPVQQTKFRTDCLALSRVTTTYSLQLFECHKEINALCVDFMQEEGTTTSEEDDEDLVTTDALTTLSPQEKTTVKPGDRNTEPLGTSSKGSWNMSAAAVGLAAGVLLALIMIGVTAFICMRRRKASRFKTLKSTASVKSFDYRKPSTKKKSVRINSKPVSNGGTAVSNASTSQELYDEIQYTGGRGNRITVATNSMYDDVVMGSSGAGIFFDRKKKSDNRRSKFSEPEVKIKKNDGSISKKPAELDKIGKAVKNDEYSFYHVLEDNETKNSNQMAKVQNVPEISGDNVSVKKPEKPASLYNGIVDAGYSEARKQSIKETSLPAEPESDFYHVVETDADPSVEKGQTGGGEEYTLYNVLNENYKTIPSSATSTNQVYDHI